MWRWHIYHVLILAAHFALARYLGSEVFLVISSHIPLIVSLFQSVTIHLYTRHVSKSHGPLFGQSAAMWSFFIEIAIDVLLGVILLQTNPLFFYPSVVLVRMISARAVHYPQTHQLRHSSFTQEATKDAYLVCKLIRNICFFFAILYPHNQVWSMWVCVLGYGLETYLQRRVTHYLYNKYILRGDAEKIVTGAEQWHEWQRVRGNLFSSLTKALFKRGQHYAAGTIIPTHLLHDYILSLNVRAGLHTLVLKPLAHRFETHFKQQDKKEPLSLSYYVKRWLVLAVIFAISAHLFSWPIVYLYGGDTDPNLFNHADLLHAIVIVIVLFPFEVADRAIDAYANSRKHNQPNVWFDFLGSVIYLYLSMNLLLQLGMRGAVYAIIFPIVWRLVVRGPWF